MPEQNNPWDILAAHFAPENFEDMAWDTADNVFLAWPVMMNFLQKSVGRPRGQRLLDFGCGAGQFANELEKLGFKVDGLDSSRAMIAKARSYYDGNVDFRTGRAAAVEPEVYEAITSIMTLQFVSDIDDTIAYLAGGLRPGGHFAFAVHNPEFVMDWARIGYRYTGFEPVECPAKGMLSFGEIKIPLFLRSAAEYNQLGQKYGLAPRLEAYPRFTEDFLRKYHVDGPTEHAEYLILGYQKI